MSLRDILTEPERINRESWIEKTKAKMDKEDWDYLISVLQNNDFSGVYVARKLTEAGYPVSGTTIHNIRMKRQWEN